MTGNILYCDISSFQGTVNWATYKQWAASFDGVARVAMKATEGVGFTDPRFQANRAGALAAGIDVILYYHYARPDLGNSAVDEANWLFHVVGNVRDSDVYMLDYEQNTSAATAQWAYDFLTRLESLTGKTPTIYASTSFVRTHLQDQRLSRFPLILANWTYDANARPSCPPPWTSYLALQYSDRASIPGIAGQVDANIYLGGATTSTYELANFPMISQRDSDKNADFDCVPASIAACLEWLTGKPYTASEVKDAVYGAGYTGGTAATAYVDYCAAHGVTLAPINGNGTQLVQALHSAIAAQHPCLITEPDPYAAGWTHVCAAYKCDASSITVMDPWIDAPVTKSDAQWASQLQFNQIWTLEKAMLSINAVSGYFTDLGNSVWKCTNGNLLGHGMLNHFCTTGSAPLFGFTLFGLPLTGEIAIPGHAGVVLQVFERGVLCYDPGHVIDNPPGSGSVYAMHLDKGDALAQLAKFLPTQPAPVDTTQAVADVQAIADAVGQAAGAAIAKAVLTIQKL